MGVSEERRGMVIERATIEDAAEILALQKLAYIIEAEIYHDFSIQPLTQTLEDLIGEFETRAVFKATQDGRLVGSVRAHTHQETCYVGKLIVHPDCQNRGIGSALMGHIETQYSSVRRFELFTGHRSLRNLYLYEKLGYEEYRREQVDENLVLVYMEKRRPAP